jgi:hypothetical protein
MYFNLFIAYLNVFECTYNMLQNKFNVFECIQMYVNVFIVYSIYFNVFIIYLDVFKFVYSMF